MDGASVQVGEKVVYRASAIGSCIRGLVAERLGHQPAPTPDKAQAWFDAGHKHEAEILHAATELVGQSLGYPVTLEHRQREVRIPVDKGIEIVGHVDALACKGDGLIVAVVDAKCRSAGMIARWEEECQKPGWGMFGRDAWQQSVYSWAFRGLPVFMVQGERLTDDMGETELGVVTLSRFDTPPYTLDEIFDRVRQIEDAARSEELPGCDKSQYPCAFYYLHPEEDTATSDPELQLMIHALDQAYGVKEEAETQYQYLRDRVEAAMRERGLSKVSWKGTTVSRVEQLRTKTNWARFRRDHAELDYEAYEDKTMSVSIRLSQSDDAS